jgi:hypothetical protein
MSESLARPGRQALIAALSLTTALAATDTANAQDRNSQDKDLPNKAAPEVEADEYVVEPSGVTVAIGPLVASRAMQMRVDADTLDHDPGLYFGGTAKLSIELFDFESIDAALLLEGEGGYGATRNREVAPELNREPVTEWSFIDARLTVRRPLSEAIVLDVGLGAYANSFIVEPNLTYTGHRYIAADMRLGLGWQPPTSDWTVAADFSALPVLSVDQSSGADGDSSAFGARAGAQIGYNVGKVASTGGYAGGRVMLRYDYTRFRTQFPQNRITLGGGVSEDDVHALTLMLGYFM